MLISPHATPHSPEHRLALGRSAISHDDDANLLGVSHGTREIGLGHRFDAERGEIRS